MKCEHTQALMNAVLVFKRLGTLTKAELSAASKARGPGKHGSVFLAETKDQKWIFQKQGLEEEQAVTLRQAACDVPGSHLPCCPVMETPDLNRCQNTKGAP